MKLPLNIDSVKGFMPPDEGEALYHAALERAGFGPLLEIGSYCGKSAVYIGTACKLKGSVLFALDHHRGSEENQPGWAHHDADTWDDEAGAMDTLPFFRRTIRQAELEDVVISLIGQSETIAKYWDRALSLVFIDGGHGRAPAYADYRAWAPKVMRGGFLAIHDVFPNPEHGGRPPFEVYQMALASGLFEEQSATGSLRILKRL